MIFRLILAIFAIIAGFLVYKSADLYLAKRYASIPFENIALGSEDSDIQMVEFLDYSCQKCQQTHASLTQFLENNPDIHYIPRPIWSENIDGNLGGVFALAAARQDKFFEVHDALMREFKAIDDARVKSIIDEVGLDEEQIKKDMQDPLLPKVLEKNRKVNGRLGSPTIPSFLLNKRIFWVINTGRVPSVEEIEKVVAETRAIQ